MRDLRIAFFVAFFIIAPAQIYKVNQSLDDNVDGPQEIFALSLPRRAAHPRRVYLSRSFNSTYTHASVIESWAENENVLHKPKNRKVHDGGVTDDFAAAEHCVPMVDWQSTHYPTCNTLHEYEVMKTHWYSNGTMYVMKADSYPKILSTEGFWRDVWKGADYPPGGGLRKYIVLKTLKWNHDFGVLATENHRKDAVAMERLSSSPFIIDIYAFCGQSTITEYAGIELRKVLKRATPYDRLRLAYESAAGLAAVHSVDYSEGKNATMAHNDLNPANIIISDDGRAKLNDFNIAEFLKWNITGNKPCGFQMSYPNPDVSFSNSTIEELTLCTSCQNIHMV